MFQFLCFLQGVRQVYVLVLGLDVLGNPYGLIHGIGEGVRDFFYEPYQVGHDAFDFELRRESFL